MIRLDAVSGTGVQAALEVETAVSPAELLLLQRMRLAERLARLDAPRWRRPTRCPLWDVADVVIHLCDTTGWALAAIAGLNADTAGPGSSQGFDPCTTPHEQVLAGRGQEPHVLLDRLRQDTATLAGRLRDADRPGVPDARWVAGQLYTPGLVALHVLWDSWLHELDLDPTLHAEGIPPQERCRLELGAVAAYAVFFIGVTTSPRLPPDEHVELHVELDDLAYQLLIGPTVRLRGAGPETRGPEARVLRGPAVATIEALAGRGELADVAEGDAGISALMSGLGARMRAPARGGHRG